VREGEREGEVYDAFATLPFVAGSSVLANLRAFKYGFSDDHENGPSHSTMVDPFGSSTAEQVLDLLKKCPRLEELYLNTTLRGIDTLFASPLLGNVRVLQYYYGADYYSPHRSSGVPYPLRALAQNKALANLITLRFHPGRDAGIDLDELNELLRSKNLPALRHLQVHAPRDPDEAAERIVASGILKRLKWLDIGYGNMTDAGAGVLTRCPDLKNLEVLDVSHNSLTPAAIRALGATGVCVVADDQHDANDWYYNVDWE
jgi:hypothetical protein